MSTIEIVDTTVRDGPQSLWATRITTAMLLPAAEDLDSAGFAAVDLAGQPQFDASVRYMSENPWDRLRLMRQRITQTPMRGWMRSKGFNFADAMPDDLIELWIERQIANGVRQITCFDGLNDIENLLVPLTIAKKHGAETIGCLAFSLSPVHTDELYTNLARELVERAKVDIVMIKDSGALLTPERIRTLVPAVKAVIGDRPLELHSHTNTGLVIPVYLEAARLGVDRLHSAVAPLGGGTAPPPTQQVLRNLRNTGFAVGVDDERVARISEHFTRVARKEGFPATETLSYDAFHYEHQVPGGMISNFKASLKEVGLENRVDDVMRECARVREDLGWPMLITPFAQLIGAQALMNVISGDRYSRVPDGVKRFALGYWGRHLAPVNPEALDRIVANGSKDIPLTPQPLAPGLPELRRRFPNMDDEERLLRNLVPGRAVDQMLAAGPTRTDYRYDRPIERLLKELAQRPPMARVFISRGDMQLELKSTNQS